MKTFYECDKSFLNRIDKLTAFINWKVEIDTCTKKKNRFQCKNCRFKTKCKSKDFNNIESYIEIKDCNNTISLDFNIKDSSKVEKFIKNDLYKLETLLNHIEKFKKEYLKALDILKENKNKKIGANNECKTEYFSRIEWTDYNLIERRSPEIIF